MDHIEPWNCTACGKLMYNTTRIDGIEYPGEGAPEANYDSPEYPRLCSMCYEMIGAIIDNPYFLQAHSDYKKEQTEYRKTVEKLKRNDI